MPSYDHDQTLLFCRDDVAVNPNDTEESIWAFLCEAKLQGPETARQNMLKVSVKENASPVLSVHGMDRHGNLD